jgi:hypothetical protein
MAHFFSTAGPGSRVTHGVATFDLPILYFRDDFFALYFTADLRKIKALMPSDRLHPVRMAGERALFGIAGFNYVDTSIGAYGEVAVVAPAVYGPKPPPLIIPALVESRYPGFGTVVLHLPVTTRVARDAGRGEWGYTKFVADMRFRNTPEFLECEMSEEDTHILTLRVERKGLVRRDRKPLITYSVRDRNLIRTVIPQRGAFRLCPYPTGAFLRLGRHPVSESIRDLALSPSPILSRYYLERGGILPAGHVIEEGVRPLDGYRGKDREGTHAVAYQ